MRPRSAAVVVLPLLLQACLASATPDRSNDYQNQSPEVRPRGHDTAERPLSGRRWTTSRNSPYQKIVSSYEQEVPEEGKDDTDQAKAKSPKRKLLRTNAPSHDQIASDTSADEVSEKIVSDSNVSGTEELQGEKKSTTLISRRRSSGGIIRDLSSEQLVEPSTANPKKRRRVVTSTSTTTLAPQTMSDSLYQYFRPLDRDVPQDDIIPFLDFGRKLSPVIPTTSSANSIDSKSMVTKLRPRNHYEDKESHSSDEEMLQEDMDVTVVKKAIERNSVPRGKLRLREQGISDYYRKRVPVQVRTTENLISTSDSSTASSVPSAKNIGVLKKINRHQISHSQPIKSSEEQVADHYSSTENSQSVPYIEVVQDKRRQYLRPVQRLAALKQEHSHSPLTAESTLVKTIIKELPNVESTTNNHETGKFIISTTSTVGDPTLGNSEPSPRNNPEINSSTLSLIKQTDPNVEQKSSSEAVVANSESVQDSLENPQTHSTTENLRQGTPSTEKTISPLPLSLSVSNETSDSKTLETESSTYTSSAVTKSSSSPTSTLRSVSEFKLPTVKTDIPLRSRDIYKPKTIPPGSLIPHLPRTIPLSNPLGNSTPKSRSPPPPTSTKTIIQETPTATALSSTTTTTTSTTSSTTTSTVKSSPTTDTTTKKTANITIKPTIVPMTVSPELQAKDMTTTTKEVLQLGDFYRSKNNDQVNTQATATPNEVKSTSGTMKTPIKENEEQHSLEIDTTHSNRDDDVIKHEEKSSQGVEADSLPPPQNEEPTEPLVIIPVFSPDDKTDHENLYPVYYTIPPTSKVPVVDTRPDTEAEVVEETNVTLPVSSTTSRPGQEWVRLGAVEKEVEVVYSEPMGLGAYILAALGVVPVLIGALIGARFLMTHNRKKVLDESEYSSEYNRSPLSITSTPLPTKLPRIPTHVSWSETEKSPLASGPAPGTSPSGRWEFPREKLRLQTLLGQGNFGQVWKAEADDIAGHEGLTRLVAVKTVKECANAREREDLLRELGIMQELGSHPNVVTLLGCCTEKEPIYVVMEYVMYGKLLSFLRDHRTRAHYYNFSDATDALTSRDLTVFAYCVARGMDYLTNKSIIHRDIAARNVLVDHNKLCKIADFGMSRNVRDTGQIYEQRQSKGALPIRWMAPESLHFSLFTHKTDVWSFGILMWEIVTLGSTPYATMGAREVMRRVRDGYRLERPTHCRAELFRVIAQCWHSEPSKRPSFAELKAELAQLLSDSEHRGSFVDLDSYADQMRRDTLHRH